MSRRFVHALLLVICFAILPTVLFGQVTGSILGVVRDASGAVIQGARVTVTNLNTNMTHETTSDVSGQYRMLALPTGPYKVEAAFSGFQTFVSTGIVLTVDEQHRVDIELKVGTSEQFTTVTATAVQVETTNTQLGDVIDQKKILDLPLNGRSYIDLFGLQPGVAPVGTRNEGAGTVSVNGQRENSNGFMVNGGDVSGAANFEASVQPNVDSIQEFRLITNGFDAEYGRFSGALMNTITKSGTNSLHGTAFEFLRNDAMDARGFFDPSAKGALKKNQFGYAVGGPAIKNKLFWFTDYQGDRQVNGGTASAIPVLSQAERNGNVGAGNLNGTVTGTYWAQVLSQRLGRSVQDGESYAAVFPDGIIPQRAFSPATVKTMQYIPLPNSGDNVYASAAESTHSRDDMFGQKVDFNNKLTGNWSGYFYVNDYGSTNPLGGSSFPTGFGSSDRNRNQLATLSNTYVLGPTAVNEFRVSYTRIVTRYGPLPADQVPSLESLGFVTGAGSLGINYSGPSGYQGIPEIGLQNFSFGSSGVGNAVQNTYQIGESFSKIRGRHTLKFGADYRMYQMNNRNGGGFVGQFSFNGNETGYDVADYLLGAPTSYAQSTVQSLDGRSRYGAAYAQDSVRLTSNLTVNFGLRWEFSTPWWDTQDKIVSLVPGLQSVQYPTAPRGLVYPGDPGVPKTLGPVPVQQLRSAPRRRLLSVRHGRIPRQVAGRPGQDQHPLQLGAVLYRHSGPDPVLDSRDGALWRVLGFARTADLRRAVPHAVLGRVAGHAFPVCDSCSRKRRGQELRLLALSSIGEHARLRNPQQAALRHPLQLHAAAPAQPLDGVVARLRWDLGPAHALDCRSKPGGSRVVPESARLRSYARYDRMRAQPGGCDLYAAGRQQGLRHTHDLRSELRLLLLRE